MKLNEATSRAKAKSVAAEDEQQKLKDQHALAIEQLQKAHDEEKNVRNSFGLTRLVAVR